MEHLEGIVSKADQISETPRDCNVDYPFVGGHVPKHDEHIVDSACLLEQ